MSLKTFSLRRKSPAAPETAQFFDTTSEDQTSSLKRGDEKRIMLMNMVKEGKLSVDGALQRAYGMGIASVPYEELDQDNCTAPKEEQIYNFGVHRYGRNNKSTKCVVQIDFEEDSLSLLQRGQKLKSFPFTALKSVVGGDDSPRLQIQFDDLNEIDIDAGTLEEKNKISRLLLLIIGQIQTGFPVLSEDVVEKRKSPVKEGVLEKKGHSAAFLMWPKRFVQLFPGEMIYYRVGEEKNESSALSIVSLLPDECDVRKLDENGFTLVTSQKEYAFRLSSNKSEEIEKERNDWMIALQTAIRGRVDVDDVQPQLHQQRMQSQNAFHQEEYLKSIASSLNDELEQLGVILNIIDAPIRASTQVTKVREIVQSLNNQINTGLLSWTLRHARNQRLSMSAPDNEDDINDMTSPYVNRPIISGQSKGVDFTANSSQSASNTLILPTNQRELQHVTQQLIDRDFAQDSRYFPYPNYRPSSSAGTPPVEGEDGPYKLYVPVSGAGFHAQIANDQYAKVNKKIKQKRCNPYVNIERRYHDLRLWGEEAPPLPPKDPSLETDESRKDEETVQEITKQKNYVPIKIQPPPESKVEIEQTRDKALSLSSTVSQAGSAVTPNVPAPPPPPPGAGGIPAPPPPPGTMVSGVPPKEDVIPGCKMRPLFWSKIPDAQIKQTVWKDATDRLNNLDTTKIEELFHLSQSTETPRANEEPDGLPIEDKNASKSLLDPKKAQNLGIFLSGFKLDVNDLESKLSTFDDENGLTSEEINALKRFQPTPEEIEMFKSFKGNFDKLVKVDKFVQKMCNITNLNSRLDVLLTIREIPDQIQGIEPPITNLIKACRSLRDNQHFKTLLEYILSIGNYLNGGTNRGRAYGFKLSALVKLVDIRSTDKKQTALQFLAEELYQKDPKVLTCYKEMNSLLIPIDISIKGLTAEVDIMSKDIEKLKKQMSTLSSSFDEAFIHKVNQFIKTESSKLVLLQQHCSEIVELSVELKRMYGESSSSDFENWLNHVSDFIKQLQRATEAAEAKQRRLTNRQKHKADLDKVVSELANTVKNASIETSNNQKPGKQKQSHRRNESYEKIISHTTLQQAAVTKTEGAGFTSKPVTFNLGNATVLELQPSESMEELSFPSKTGWLEKLSGGKKRNCKWDYRFFELTTTGYLHYSKREDGKLSGAIYIRQSPVKVDENDPCIMEIHHEQRVWKLRGDNELEVSDWLNALNYYSKRDSVLQDDFE
ncbi:formin-F-like [Clytia hemisphaerica]|uniref:Uncharacterized protein n=1 Tax=Clytia hemisphaerica TaxID=252671 RepID=A0A7M6DP73_9CNID